MAAWLRVAFAMFAVGWGANQFSPMLIVYRDRLGLSASALGAIFGVYAIGLIPGLLLGGAASDRRGRRALALPFVALSPVASLLLILARESLLGLGAARFLAGMCSGVVFSVGSAWVQELSGDTGPGVAARRAAVALSLGFGVGPLVAALLAQWAPDPLWLPYIPHLLLGAGALTVLLRAPETIGPVGVGGALFRVPRAVRSSRFRQVVAPLAPWVFGCAAFAFVVLPQQVSSAHSQAVGFAGLVTALTLGTGVLLQPLTQRMEGRRALSGAILGLVGAVVGLGLGVLALALESQALVVCAAVPLGAGYGMCLVSGLRETERLSAPEERGVTVAVYYALTYLGFSVPYLISLMAHALGDIEILVVFALLAIVGLGVLVSATPLTADRRSRS
jgi:MFS family permease